MVGRTPAGRTRPERGARGAPCAFDNVGGWPTRSPHLSSRVRSTCCCTSCPPTRSTSSTSRSCRWSTGSWPSSPSSASLIDFNQLSEFLLVASILIELKSQRLLPGREGRTRTRTSSGGRSATCCWPACSSAGPTPPRPTSSSPWPSRRRARSPARSGSTTTSSCTPRTSWPAITPEDVAQAYLRGSAERPVPRVDLSHVTVDTVSVSEAVSELIAVPELGARHVVPRPGRAAAGPASRSSCASWPCSSCARWAG